MSFSDHSIGASIYDIWNYPTRTLTALPVTELYDASLAGSSGFTAASGGIFDARSVSGNLNGETRIEIYMDGFGGWKPVVDVATPSGAALWSRAVVGEANKTRIFNGSVGAMQFHFVKIGG